MTTTTHKRTRQDWIDLIARCDGSGLTQAGFCQQNGLNLNTMHEMRRRIRRAAETGAQPKAADPQTKASPPGGWVRLSPITDVVPPETDLPTIHIECGSVRITMVMAS
jgi:hypothetical protein